MKIAIAKRYMLLPVSQGARKKTLVLRDSGRIVTELELRLSDRPDYIYPYDLRHLLGRTLELSVTPEVDFVPRLVDAPDDAGLYREKYRPAAHFTARRGWTNDPNGLIRYEGRYHMFFQHNPVDSVWGNMHWGHAVSDDLTHWTELEEALFPDEHGAIFSGSAVVDTRNVTGLKRNEHDPFLLFYTAAPAANGMSRGRLFTQRLAYSTDGGRTFEKYPHALIGHIAASNRDPKVVWCDELERYVLALYLTGSEFCLFTSANLLQWDELQRVVLEEDNECPDFYPLELDGERFWVLTAAHDRYCVGKIEGGRFVPKYPAGRLSYGDKFYAAQTFYNAPDRRRIRFGWNQSHAPGMPFEGAMTTPHDMTLRRVDGRSALCAWPSVEFEALRGERAEGEGRLDLSGRANDIMLSVPSKGARTLSLFGLDLEIDGDRGLVRACQGGPEMPVRSEDGLIRLRLVQDVHSVEVYAGHGEAMMCLAHLSDGLLNRAQCEGARITAWPLG